MRFAARARVAVVNTEYPRLCSSRRTTLDNGRGAKRRKEQTKMERGGKKRKMTFFVHPRRSTLDTTASPDFIFQSQPSKKLSTGQERSTTGTYVTKPPNNQQYRSARCQASGVQRGENFYLPLRDTDQELL